MANDPTTVEQLYTDILGRASDPGGLAYWQQQFGNEVDPNELATFKSAAQAELANRTPTEQTALAPNLVNASVSSAPINPYFTANPDVAASYAANSYGMTPDQFAQYHYQNYGVNENRSAPTTLSPLQSVGSNATPDYDKIVKDAYATNMGIDPTTITPNNEGLNYWKTQLATGALKPEDFNKAFEYSANEYIKGHPSDAASTYFQNYRLGQQKDTIKSTFSDILKDKSVSLDEANTIQAYEDKYNFTPEQIASVTGYSVDAIKEILNSKQSIIKNVVKSNVSNPLGLSDFATKNGVTAKQLADASNGAFTEEQAQDYINKSQSFQGRLEMVSPDAYNQIKGLTQYTANENFGGKTQDYQVQLFTPLDITKTGIPTQLEFTPSAPITSYDENGNPYTYTPRPQIKNANVTQDEDGNFVSTTPTYVNGVPVTASYDANGKITNYQGDPRVVTWLDGSHYVYGNWDAQGNAKPAQVATKGGGFIKNMASDIASSLKDLGPAWTVAKLFNPELALVDVATDIGQGKFNLGTAVNAVSGYGGLQTASATDMLNPSSANYVNTIDQGYNVAQVPNINVSNPVTGALANASTAKLVASSLVAIDAADKGNYAPILNVVANVSGANQMPEVAIAANTLAAVDAINKNSPGALMTAAGNLVNSPDLKVAGAATKFIQAYNSGNQAAITTSGAELFSSINANVPEASKMLKNLVSDATSAISPSTPTAPLSTGSTITYDQNGNPTSTPSGTSPKGALPSGTQVASNDGGLPNVEVGGPPIFADSFNANTVKAPFGFDLMPASLNEKGLRPSGAFYDQFQNAWFMPNEDVQDLQTAIQSGTTTGISDKTGISPISGSGNGDGVVGPLTTLTPPSTSDMGNVTIVDKRPVTDLPVTDMGNVTITDKKPDYSTITDTDLLPHDVTPTTVTPTTTTTSPLSSVSNISSYTAPKQITNAPSTLASVEVPSLESNPTGLTSKNKKDKKILKELEMLFGTLTPELVSALQDRGIYVPQELAMKDESSKDTSKDETDKTETSKKDTIKEETEKEIADNKALETKLVATGGSIASTIDQPITYKQPGLLAAPALLDIPSRLGTLKHLREGLTSRTTSGLARGGLPHKYAEAMPDGHKPEFITGLTGYYASGKGTGQSDDIDAMLHDGDYVADADLVAALGDGSSKAGAEALEKFRRQVPHQHSVGGQPVPAKIADGEYVFPSSFVTAIGKGDNKEGAKILDKMREAIRAHKRSAPTSKIPPKAKSPLDYLKMVKG